MRAGLRGREYRAMRGSGCADGKIQMLSSRSIRGGRRSAAFHAELEETRGDLLTGCMRDFQLRRLIVAVCFEKLNDIGNLIFAPIELFPQEE